MSLLIKDPLHPCFACYDDVVHRYQASLVVRNAPNLQAWMPDHKPSPHATNSSTPAHHHPGLPGACLRGLLSLCGPDSTASLQHIAHDAWRVTAALVEGDHMFELTWPGGRDDSMAAGVVDGAERGVGPLEVQERQEGAAGPLGSPAAECLLWLRAP